MIIEKGIDMNKETNLEHYKEDLKHIINCYRGYSAAINDMIRKKLDKNFNYTGVTYNGYFTDYILDWMAQPYEESVLDDVEKAYLSAVIKPFRNRIRFIVKIRYKLLEQEFIYISVEGNSITFPPFKLGTKYKGMEVNIKYSLEELGL